MMGTVKKRHKSFHWIEEAKKSFKLLKEKIIGQRVLILPYFSKTFQGRCDTSEFEIGAVLSQDNRPVAYFNEKLNDAKRNYSMYGKEFYAIIQALKKWRHYMVPKEVICIATIRPYSL